MSTVTQTPPLSNGFAGSYLISDAALYLRATMDLGKLPALTSRHLHYWIREGLAARYVRGVQGAHRFITFADLVSFRAIAIMRAHGVKPKEIRIVEAELRRTYGWEYPFAMAPFWTWAPDVVLRVNEHLVAVSRHWQMAMAFIERDLKPVHNLTFDLWDHPSDWAPQDGILLTPTVQYGEPCITGTRIPTQVVWAFNRAGDSLDDLARMYGLPKAKLKVAVDWERRLHQAAA
tara:strand:- start:9359 stop:10054 length:696 start_codon:yes stop_codon:yes gene_type:complete